MSHELDYSQIAALKNAPIKQLQSAYQRLLGKAATLPRNRIHCWRKVAYSLQEKAADGLSAKALAKIDDLIKQYDPINNKAFRPNVAPQLCNQNNRRLPIPGTTITKLYKRTKIEVRVLDKGFEYNGTIYKSLTAIAKEVTGAHWSGYTFFNL